MKSYRSINELKGKLGGKSAVIRIDANVPMVNGHITDGTRLDEALPSIKFLLNEGVSQLVILSHLGRPKQKEKELSLIQVKDYLQNIIKEEVVFAGDIRNIPNAKIVLVENLRYFKEEESGEDEFAKMLASLGDFYINDAFSCSHRAHASISVISKFTKVYAGFLMMKEIESIDGLLNGDPIGGRQKSFAIVGGSKVSTKITLLENLITKLDSIFIAGGMANTFLYASGFNVGASLCEKDLKETALSILKKAKDTGCNLMLPLDVITCKKIEKSAPSRMVEVNEIQDDEIIVDAGNRTLSCIVEALLKCEMFLWNGPLGVFEVSPFGVSTFALAREVGKLTLDGRLKSIIGGGDTASAVLESGFKHQMTYTSTAGGAFLEWLEGRVLPGVEAVKIL